MRRVYPRLACTVIGLLYLLAPGLSASPAGVIPYSCLGGEAYVLLAFDPVSSRLGFGAFGGGRQGGESIAETAAREMREETRCAFDGPTAADLEASTPSNSGGFYSFVSQVPYIPQGEIPASACDAAIERVDWQWIRLSDLLTALQGDDPRPQVLVSLMHRVVTLWEGAAESLRQAQRDELLHNNLCR